MSRADSVSTHKVLTSSVAFFLYIFNIFKIKNDKRDLDKRLFLMFFSRVTERKGKILIAYRDMLAGVVSSGSAPRVYCEVSIAIKI